MEREPHSTHAEIDETEATGAGDSDPVVEEVKGDKGALWLLVGVVVLAGSTLWLIRDIWTSKPAVLQAESATAAEGNPVATSPQQQANDQSAVDAAQDQFDALRRQKEESLLAAKKEAALNDEQRREAEQQLKEERDARAELEKQRLADEKKLAEERAALEKARLAIEQQLKAERVALEQARQDAEQKLASERAARQALEEQRSATEQKMASERLERAALERRAALEKQKLLEAQQKALQAERERALAAETLQAEQSRLRETVPSPEQVAGQSTQEDSAGAATDAGADSMNSKFSSNPCDGPSAKFLSTCR